MFCTDARPPSALITVSRGLIYQLRLPTVLCLNHVYAHFCTQNTTYQFLLVFEMMHTFRTCRDQAYKKFQRGRQVKDSLRIGLIMDTLIP